MKFTTSRFHYRLIQPQDESDYCSLYTNAKVMGKIAPPLSQEQAAQQFEKVLKNAAVRPYKQLVWCISYQQLFCGIQSLLWHQGNAHQAEIGIMLNQPASGKKVPEEAMGALVDYGITQLDLKRINAYFDPSNIPVARFVTKLGFTIQQQILDRNGRASQFAYIHAKTWLDRPNRVIAQLPTQAHLTR